MGYKEHKSKSLWMKKIGCAVLTISDTRTKEKDKSGKFITEKLAARGYDIAYYGIIKNKRRMIREEIWNLSKSKNVHVLITTGGTGIGKKDVTVDAVKPLLDKELVGFGEMFRVLSYYEVGSASIMSRALGGVINGKVIFCLPGALEAVKLAMNKFIIPEIQHMVWEVSK